MIFLVLESWPPEWHTPASSTMETEKSTTKHKKEENFFWMAQLVEKRMKEEAVAKAQVVHNTAKLAEQ